MGSALSLPNRRKRTREQPEMLQTESCKRMRVSYCYDDVSPRLIPALPDEISMQILARVPRIQYLKLKMVSCRWKAAIVSGEVFKARKENGTTEEWLYILMIIGENNFSWHAVDPVSKRWQRLPPMPAVPCEEESKRGSSSGFRTWNVMMPGIKVAHIIKCWLGCKTVSVQMPYSGCSVGAVDGCLYVLGGFSRQLAMKCAWQYDPRVNMWQEVSSMNVARGCCKTGLLNGKLYVVGGVTRGGIIPLQSAEAYDPQTGVWTQVPSMPFAHVQEIPDVLFAFDDMIKPMATGMASYTGRLCVPQSMYMWPFFVDAGGEVYDPEIDSWVGMPPGMGEGWPAKQAGSKLSVIVDGELYALDPSSSLVNGNIKIYNPHEDAWKVVLKKVPVHDFVKPECPYLLASFHRKLHVITKRTNNDTAVFQADLQHVHSSPSVSPVPVDSTVEEEKDVWKLIAAKNFGAAELFSCQVLDV